jgi:hypothetical protein
LSLSVNAIQALGIETGEHADVLARELGLDVTA